MTETYINYSPYVKEKNSMNIPKVDGEEYYIMRDEFLRYIDTEVNPQRIAHKLSQIREHEARECYRYYMTSGANGKRNKGIGTDSRGGRKPVADHSRATRLTFYG